MKTDVCLIMEGSYPFVVGGVSTWVHDLLTSLDDISFSVVHIGVSKDLGDKPKYEFPKNVLEFRQIHLMDTVSWKWPGLMAKRSSWKALGSFMEDVANGDFSNVRALLEQLSPDNPESLTPHDIFHGKQFWNLLVQQYQEHFPDFSFIDFFWTVRFMVLPLFRVLYADIPEAGLYHATCTGYAGLFGSVASIRTGAPAIITEHGIYTNERMIEITQAQWIYREKRTSLVPTKQLGALQGLWMKKFDVLSRIAYDQAAGIFTLYEGNRQMQIQGGASPDNTRIIANGIDIERYDRMAIAHDDLGRGPLRVCMVGRVAPIKDVKTFIRAAKMVSEEMPGVRFQVLGPQDEDETYYEECERLVRVLSLKNVFEFTGGVDMQQYYPGMSCLVMTSISEAQPFVLLEAMRIGIPVVSSSVGACSEMVYGATDEDRAIGSAGIVTNVRSPKETADAILRILRDPVAAKAMGQAGRERVGRYYLRSRMLDEYHEVYRQYCGGGA